MSPRGVAVHLLVLGSCAAGLGCGSGAPSRASAPTAPERTAEGSAVAFLDAYVTREGRVRRPDQGNDTVSEGQAYAMLAAAAVGDEKRFDRVWGWTKANLRRPDGLLSFRWADGRVDDPQAATDADVDAARALLVAGCRFDRPALEREALALGRRILALETTNLGGVRLLVAGPWARRAPVVINPSYLDPTALQALGRASGDPVWGTILAASRRAVAEVSAPLPPDWAVVEGGRARAVAAADGSGVRGRYGFDAPRALLRAATSPDAVDRRLAARAWPVFEGSPAAELVVERRLDGAPDGESRHPVALVGAASAARAAGERQAQGRLLDAADALQQKNPTYYGGAMVALGRLLLQTDLLDPTC